jgi:hypothetical protein
LPPPSRYEHDALIRRVDRIEETFDRRVVALETQVDDLQRRVWWLIGGAGLATAGLAILVTTLLAHIRFG